MVRRPVDEVVKGDIERYNRVQVFVGDGRVQRGHGCGHGREVVVGRMSDGAFHRQTFEGFAQFVDFIDVILRQTRDSRATVAFEREQALSLEGNEGFPNWSSADAEAFCQTGFVEMLTGLESAPHERSP